jgi:hypothetical protein
MAYHHAPSSGDEPVAMQGEMPAPHPTSAACSTSAAWRSWAAVTWL